MFDYVIDRATADLNRAQHCAFGSLRVGTESRRHDSIPDHRQTGARLATGTSGDPVDLPLSARVDSWKELTNQMPKPGFKNLSTMRRTQNLIVTGDKVKFQQHILLLEMLFSNLSDNASAPDAIIEPVASRYLHLRFEGRPHRIYFEEVRQGIPLICLHTIGSDGKQYRHLLNDPAVTDRFRVIAFDLPWHGKSSLLPGFEAEVYELTNDRYATMVETLKLGNPIVMGCSIGGRAVLHLA